MYRNIIELTGLILFIFIIIVGINLTIVYFYEIIIDIVCWVRESIKNRFRK